MLDPNAGAFREDIVNTKSKGRDNPVDAVTVRVFVGEKIEQEIEVRLVHTKLDVSMLIGISIVIL